MNILRKDYNFRNVLIFLLLSLVFLLSIHALSVADFLFNKTFLIMTLKENYLTILVGLLAIYSVYNFKKISQYLLLIFLFFVVVKSFIFLSTSFNKLVLGLNFIYIVFSFYFFTQWELFTQAAYNNSNFTLNDLELKTRFPIEGKIVLNDGTENKIFLTNIDEEGCFVVSMNDEIQTTLEIECQIIIPYEGVEFKSIGKCVSRYGNGAGFRLINNDNNLRSLSGLYQVCLERGLFA